LLFFVCIRLFLAVKINFSFLSLFCCLIRLPDFLTSEVPDDPSPLDARRALKTLQKFASKNLFGVAPMDALMKLEISMIDAKIDGIYRRESALPECE